MSTDTLDQDALLTAIERLPVSGELAEVLTAVTDELCSLLGVRRCRLFLREGSGGSLEGRACRCADGRLAIDGRKPPAALAEEVLASARPVLGEEKKGEWASPSQLAVPLLLGEEVEGIAILDDVERRRVYSPAAQTLALAYARVVTPIVVGSRIAGALRQRLADAERRNRLLAQAAAADQHLSSFALGADVKKLVAAVAKLTHRPVALYDSRFERRAESGPAQTVAILEEPHRSGNGVAELIGTGSGKPTTIVGPFSTLGSNARWLIAPVGPADRPAAYLVVEETESRFRAVDQLVVGRAVTSVALALAGDEQAAAETGDAREVLAGELIRGRRDTETLRALARAATMSLGSEHVIALIRERTSAGPPLPTPRAAAQVLERCLGARAVVLGTGVTEGLALVVPLRMGASREEGLGEVVGALRAWCESVAPGGALAVVVSSVCKAADGYPRAYTEAHDAAGTIGELADGAEHTVTAVDDLGLARMFLLRPDAVSSRRFLVETLGPLLDPGDARHGELLETLRAFLRAGHNIRACARAMFVHENTVRYRLTRIQELLGVDLVGDPEAQLTLQMAMTMLALTGRAAGSRAAVAGADEALSEA